MSKAYTTSYHLGGPVYVSVQAAKGRKTVCFRHVENSRLTSFTLTKLQFENLRKLCYALEIDLVKSSEPPTLTTPLPAPTENQPTQPKRKRQLTTPEPKTKRKSPPSDPTPMALRDDWQENNRLYQPRRQSHAQQRQIEALARHMSAGRNHASNLPQKAEVRTLRPKSLALPPVTAPPSCSILPSSPVCLAPEALQDIANDPLQITLNDVWSTTTAATMEPDKLASALLQSLCT